MKDYNSLGSKVSDLINEYKFAGNYSVHFNGANLPSGMYFYRLESGNYTAVRKLILLK
ncbi:MAG: T9SS type A sorting domain-containing protein [Ignavibacteriaceae bacterium]|nr:T9SS type A sorting domain-containing protein [Ignavibacteriaceae bacterium]